MSAPPIWRYLPARREEIPILTSIPHTGTFVPMRSLRSSRMLRPPRNSWPTGTCMSFYAFLPDLGVDVLHATHHRFVVDLNRPADSRPPVSRALRDHAGSHRDIPGRADLARAPDARRSRCARGEVPPSLSRRAGKAPCAEKVAQFGRCYLIDLHTRRIAGEPAARRVAGGRFSRRSGRHYLRCGAHRAGTRPVSCREAAGQSSINPTRADSSPRITARWKACKALQIEMCQRLYMLEGQPASATAQPRFAAFQRVLEGVFTGVADAIRTPQFKC